MLFSQSVPRRYQQIVHVDYEERNLKFSKDIVHHLLEGSWGIAHSEEHDQRFISAMGGYEHAFPLVSLFNPDVIVPPSQIHFAEHVTSLDTIYELRDEW